MFRRTTCLLFAICCPLISITLGVSWSSEAKAKPLAELVVNHKSATESIKLTKIHMSLNISDTSLLSSYEFDFKSQFKRNLEGTFYFNLPRQAYIHEFGYWVDGKYKTAAIVPAKQGRVAYESIVRRGIDPALVEWSAGSAFKMRVFPVLPGQITKVKLVMGAPFQFDHKVGTVSLPLGTEKLANFQFDLDSKLKNPSNVNVTQLRGLQLTDGKASQSWSNFLPPKEIKVVISPKNPRAEVVSRFDGDKTRYFEFKLTPRLTADKRPAAKKTVIFWDSSLSAEKTRADRIEVLKNYLDARKPAEISLVTFAASLKNGGNFSLAEKGKLIAQLQDLPFDGATRIDLALKAIERVAKQAGANHDVVVFTDGVDSFELADLGAASKSTFKSQNFLVVPGAGVNPGFVQLLSGRFAAQIIDAESDIQAEDFRELPWSIASVQLSRNLSDHDVVLGQPFAAGNSLLIRGKLRRDGKHTIKLKFVQAGRAVQQEFKLDTTKVKLDSGSNVARIWGVRRINTMLPEKRTYRQQILDIALEHKLMSPYTSMVVLETCEDYEEFNIKPPGDCERRKGSSLLEDAVDMFLGGDENEDEYAEEYAEGEEDYDAGEMAELDAAEAGPSDAAANYSAAAAPPLPDSSQNEPAPEAGEDYGDEELADYDDVDEGYEDYEAPILLSNTPRVKFGFEMALNKAAGKGKDRLYSVYLKLRPGYEKIPYFYFFTAGLFKKLKQNALADQVLSNVVEIRPGEPRWLRLYAFQNSVWGNSAKVIPLYRVVTELREEDPHGFRDYGLALERSGNLLEALNAYEKVHFGKWDSRLQGTKEVVQEDLSRVAKKLAAAKTIPAKIKSRVRSHLQRTDANDVIVVTVSWDTDNTDIDLHVKEPDGTHIFYGNANPTGRHGRISQDQTGGFGPEQYRNNKAVQGKYEVYLRYYSSNPNAIKDGTFVRVDIKTIINGKVEHRSKLEFLGKNESTRLVDVIQFDDIKSPKAPPSFRQGYQQAKQFLSQKQFMKAYNILNKLGKRPKTENEAKRLFQLARAAAGVKKYKMAMQYNQAALVQNPKMLAAHYNNACYAALQKDRRSALFHMNLLSTALERYGTKRDYRRYFNLMKKDSDLASIRSDKIFRNYLTIFSREYRAH